MARRAEPRRSLRAAEPSSAPENRSTGGEPHAQVTATGDTVNAASRLQEIAKQHGADCVVSRAGMDATAPGSNVPHDFVRHTVQPV